MDLFQIRYENSAWQLYRGYMRGAKKALSAKDVEMFKLYRKGYEVLRHEESFEAYHRIYRKYILNQKLNYPALKEKQLIAAFREKENIGEKFVDSYEGNLPHYSAHRNWIIAKFFGFEFSQIFHGISGLIFIGIGLWCMISFRNSPNLIGGIFIIIFGLIFSIRNFKYYIKR